MPSVEVPGTRGLVKAAKELHNCKRCFSPRRFLLARRGVQERLDFALYHLGEMQAAYSQLTPRADFRIRAERDSFLHCLYGAFDLLGHVLNHVYGLGLPENVAKFLTVRDAMSERFHGSAAAARLTETSQAAIFAEVSRLRHGWTHRWVPSLLTHSAAGRTWHLIMLEELELGDLSQSAAEARTDSRTGEPYYDAARWCREALAFAAEEIGEAYTSAARDALARAGDPSVPEGRLDLYHDVPPGSPRGRLVEFLEKWKSGDLTYLHRHLYPPVQESWPAEEFDAFLRHNAITGFTLGWSCLSRGLFNTCHFQVFLTLAGGDEVEWYVVMLQKGETWRVGQISSSPTFPVPQEYHRPHDGGPGGAQKPA
jgi:hypothetical protein